MPSSTPRTRPCSGAAAWTGRFTAAAARPSSPNAGDCGNPATPAACPPVRRRPARAVTAAPAGGPTAAGPVYSARDERSAVLASCYAQSLRVADELGARVVVFPAVSAGIYGWPAGDAARIALTTVSQTPSQLEEARFVLFTEDMLAVFSAVLESLGLS